MKNTEDVHQQDNKYESELSFMLKKLTLIKSTLITEIRINTENLHIWLQEGIPAYVFNG